MNGERPQLLLVISLLLIANIGRSQGAADAQAEEVVWQYLNNEMERGRTESGYWEWKWRSPLPASDTSITLGKPYARDRLPDAEIESFIATGDLLQSATIHWVCFPVSNGGTLIGTVWVWSRDGRWVWYGSGSPAGSADSLAIAFQQKGSDASLVGADHLGAFLIIAPQNGAEKRVYPLYKSMRSLLQKQLDPMGTLSYSSAMEALRPIAQARVDRQIRQGDR